MSRFSILSLALVFAVAPASAEELKTAHQKTLYSLGLQMAEESRDYALTASEIPYVLRGLEDGLRGKKPKVDLAGHRHKLTLLKKERVAKRYETFHKKAAAEKGAKRYPSGLIYKETKKGTGRSPKATDKVRAHYHGTLIDGKVFDSSVRRNQPLEIGLNQVIKCWTEGMQLMKEGGKARLVCPADIAYGPRGRPPVIPGGATLIFDVELLKVLTP